jgi:hypothetical protein
MSKNPTNLVSKDGKILGTLFFDGSARCWRLTCVAEPNFQRTFATQQDAFYFWYSMFDATIGKLRGGPGHI